MGVNYNTKIVSDNMVLCLDGANPASYVAGSTVWKDIKSSRNLTIVGGPNYTADKSFDFSNTTDYAGFLDGHDDLEFQPVSPYSVFVLMKSKAYVGGALVSNMPTGAPNTGWDLWQNTSTSMAMHLISDWTTKNAIKIAVDYDYTANLDKWIYFGYTYDGSSPLVTGNPLASVNFYLNGALYTTNKTLTSDANGFFKTDTATPYAADQRFRVGARYGVDGAFANSPSPNIQVVHVYKKQLSANEVMQNYIALRGRFGI